MLVIFVFVFVFVLFVYCFGSILLDAGFVYVIFGLTFCCLSARNRSCHKMYMKIRRGPIPGGCPSSRRHTSTGAVPPRHHYGSAPCQCWPSIHCRDTSGRRCPRGPLPCERIPEVPPLDSATRRSHWATHTPSAGIPDRTAGPALRTQRGPRGCLT